MRIRTRLAAVGSALALGVGGLLAAAPATAAPLGPCDRPEGVYASSGTNFTVQNCRSTTQNLQLVIISDGTVTHREACTALAPAGRLSILNGTASADARWSWSYC